MIKKLLLIVIPLVFVWQCAPKVSYVQYFNSVVNDLQFENYSSALKKIDLAKKENRYTRKERVLYYLDKGLVDYYAGDYNSSIKYLESAEQAMEELFTRSVSQIAASYLLNDNVMDYYGEVYENLYVNIFKALDYLNLNKMDDALVEAKRANLKLQELDEKYGKMVDDLNSSKDSKVKITKPAQHFYDDVLAHYLSYLVYRSDEAEDEALISKKKLLQAYETESDVYYFDAPLFLKKRMPELEETTLDVIAFTGSAPRKEAVGGLITTYDGYIGISDLSQPIALPNIPFPGMKAGYHFKFAFPVIQRVGSKIARINMRIDGKDHPSLYLLEDMGKVAEKTFETKRNMIYIKTLVRTISKGLLAAEAKKKMKKKTNGNLFMNALIDAAVDVGVDATEKADVRCWRTMPENCYVGEYFLNPGNHSLTVQFMTRDGLLIKEKKVMNYRVKKGVNILDFVSLN